MRSLNPFHWRRSAAEFDEVDIERRDRCSACEASLVDDELYARLRVCTPCGKHYLFPAPLRIRSIVDARSFRETHKELVSTDPLHFADDRAYVDVRDDLRQTLKLSDALVTGTAAVDKREIVLAVIDFRFLGGSMGVVVGEKLARAAELAAKRQHPLITVVSSGGARMQEGMFSLFQMAKTAAAIERLRESGTLYVSVLASPTTGGVLASFASMGDVILAEPEALIGFAGPRVVEELLGEPLPPESHSAEFLHAHGMVDAIVHREQLRSRLTELLEVTSGGKKHAVERQDLVQTGSTNGDMSAWELVGAVRDETAPTTLDHIAALCDRFVELHGDQQGGDDAAVVAGLAVIAGRPVAIAGFERGHGDNREFRRFGRPMPHGYRKIQRLMRLASRLKLPVVTLIDTPGAFPGIESEKSGLAREIAETLALAVSLPVPTIAVVTGEGGSGGALTLAVADRVYMLEQSFFSVIAPEGAAAILYRDAAKAPELAEKLGITPQQLLDFGLIDGVIHETMSGADPELVERESSLKATIVAALDELEKKKTAKLLSERHERYRSIGSEFVKGAPKRRQPRPPASQAAAEDTASIPGS